MEKPFHIEADDNFRALKANPYPGRGIVAGLDSSGKYLVQVYWIMGRSENSRNRVFKVDHEGRLYTEAADPSKMQDPSLIIYNAMRERGPHYIVSNGDQTDTVYDNVAGALFLEQVLRGRTYEPDKPNFTQRITAVSSLSFKGHPHVQMSVLRKSRFGDGCDEATYYFDGLQPGVGHCVTTYSGDGDPLPPFRGEPLLMPLGSNIDYVAKGYWDNLNPQNRVALAVKFINLKTGVSTTRIKNEYEQVAA